MLAVRFNSLEEYLAELRADAALIEDRILRVTCRHSRRGGEPIRSLRVAATCMIRGKIVLLDSFQGEIWGLGSKEDERTETAAKAALCRLKSAAKDMGLEIRAGVIEETTDAAQTR